MEAPLQQRIVGAIVLVTLGVIFIPALLDGSGYRTRQATDIEIREKPEFPPLTQIQVQPIPTPLEDIKKAQQQALAADPVQPHKIPVKSFALQVGTFDNNANAEKMRDKLQQAGYATFIKQGQSNGKTSYKVRIGPQLERSVLEKIKKDIEKSDKIDAYIVNHP